LTGVRFLLPLGWLLAAIGYYGPWIAHSTAALTLSGVDMAEFVKFLPGALDGTLRIARQLFYLPPLAVVVSIALLIGAQRLGFPWPVRAFFLVLAVPISLQLLPPAWSIASLTSAEFRLQTIALGIAWLLLAGFWLWGRLPSWLTGSPSALLSLAALGLSFWQYVIAKPAIDRVYGTPPSVGWGFLLCMVGLLAISAASVMLVLRGRARSGEAWTGE
jgi:hypothetical protein